MVKNSEKEFFNISSHVKHGQYNFETNLTNENELDIVIEMKKKLRIGSKVKLTSEDSLVTDSKIEKKSRLLPKMAIENLIAKLNFEISAAAKNIEKNS